MALLKAELNESIKGDFKNGTGLQYEIMEDLKQAIMRFASKNADGSDTTVEMNPFDADEVKKKYPNSEPRTITNLPTKNRTRWSGTEAIVESIVEKTIDKFVDKIVDAILDKLVVYITTGKVIVAVSGGSGSAAVGTPNPSRIICEKE